MRRLCLALLAGLTCAVAPSPGSAAGRWVNLAATIFHNYGRDQGLPHPVPTALAQDHNGFIWIGTQGGLARWDGYRFHSYKADPAVAGSLPDDFIQTLHVDTAGRLWIGSSAGGLARYDSARDRFEAIPIEPSSGRIHIGALADDGSGGLWVGTNRGLHHLNSATGKASPPPSGPSDLPEGRVLAVEKDRSGTLWVGTATGLVRRDRGAAGFAPVPLGSEAVGVSALIEDGEGRIWIGTVRRGLFVVDRNGRLPRPIGVGPDVRSSSVSGFVATGPHEIWAGLRGVGIAAIDTATGQVRRIRHDRTVPNSLAHDDVWSLLRDQAGSIWVGSTGGLSYRPRDTGLISAVLGTQAGAMGLSASDVLSVLAARDGRVWLGYLDGGADIIDPTIGRVGALRPDAARPDEALPPDVLLTMAEGDDGTIYFGTRRGLYRTGPTAGTVRLITLPGRDPHAAVTTLAFDRGILWIGGSDDGLWGIRPDGDRAAMLVFGPKEAAKLTDPGIAAIRRGAGNDLWVGTRNGLNRIDLASGAIEHIAAAPKKPDALPGRFVPALLFDRQGRLWVATFGGGLAVMTGRKADGSRRFRRLGLADGLPHLNVDSLATDGAGTIWAGTDDGLARIDPLTLAVRAVRQADGSALIDYFAGAGTSNSAGEALFGAKGGLTVVRPGVLPPWWLRPPVVVTDLRIGGVAVPIARFNGTARPAPIILTPETNSLAVEFAALDFTAPERNRYAYRLDGFDAHWIETDASRRLAIYTNLPPGDYTLHLRGSNRAGLWAERDLALPVRVLPAWYQRLWFKLAGAALLLLAIGAIVSWRTAYLRRRQGDLEKQIAERTADLRAANERLGQLARTDPLTGCASRRHFMEQARDMIALAGRHRTPLSLTIFDLDDFKQVNDSHGHPGGDAVLAMTGLIIAREVRSTDLVGRIGGEEFALLMPHTGIAEARSLADRLREAIGANAIDVDGASVHITASMGVAELQAGEDFDSLYARADAALYVAKETGRNRVETISPAG